MSTTVIIVIVVAVALVAIVLGRGSGPRITTVERRVKDEDRDDA